MLLSGHSAHIPVTVTKPVLFAQLPSKPNAETQICSQKKFIHSAAKWINEE